MYLSVEKTKNSREVSIEIDGLSFKVTVSKLPVITPIKRLNIGFYPNHAGNTWFLHKLRLCYGMNSLFFQPKSMQSILTQTIILQIAL